MAECTDHRDRLVDIDTVEHPGQFRPVDLRAPHPEGFHPRPLHEVEHRLTILLANRIAQDRPEKADILAHRFGRLPAELCAANPADRFQRHLGDLSHVTSIGARAGTRSTSARQSCAQAGFHPQSPGLGLFFEHIFDILVS